VIGVLLILEVIGLVVLGGYEFLQVYWRGSELRSPQHQVVEVAVFALFIPSAVLTLLSALSFLFLQNRGAWRCACGSTLCSSRATSTRSWPTAY
jgi:hypothetical protein